MNSISASTLRNSAKHPTTTRPPPIKAATPLPSWLPIPLLIPIAIIFSLPDFPSTPSLTLPISFSRSLSFSHSSVSLYIHVFTFSPSVVQYLSLRLCLSICQSICQRLCLCLSLSWSMLRSLLAVGRTSLRLVRIDWRPPFSRQHTHSDERRYSIVSVYKSQVLEI